MLRKAATLLPPTLLLRNSACSVGGFTPSLGGLLSAGLLRGSGAAAAAPAAASPSGGAAAATRGHTSDASKQEGAETISVTFIDKDDTEHTVKAPVGMHLLEVAHQNEIDLEGACEASLACSTCHLIVENEEYFKRIPEAEEDELDMLDLAFGLTETSRLGCQIIAAKDLDGIRVRIPSATRNFYVDGHKPKPH